MCCLIGIVLDVLYSKFSNELLKNKTHILPQRYDAFSTQSRHVSKLKISNVIFLSCELFSYRHLKSPSAIKF